MRTFICGLHPRGSACETGKLLVGDLLIKVGDYVVWDRCHLNVTTIIKNLPPNEKVDIVVLRNKKYAADLSVKPVTHYPLLLDDMVSCLVQSFKPSQKLFRSLRVETFQSLQPSES